MHQTSPAIYGIQEHLDTNLCRQLLLEDPATASSPPPVHYRRFLAKVSEHLDQAFRDCHPVRQLVALRCFAVDQVLANLWIRTVGAAHANIALIAVGGYGRAELFPHSDIDLLILCTDETSLSQHQSSVESFITALWDLKLDIGHSVRTLSDCIEQGRKDLTIATNLLETRRLQGDQELATRLHELAYSDACWTDADFFEAKVEEQRLRHQRYGDSEYNLEPNIKTSSGGLRDIQTVHWIAKRHLGADAHGSPDDRFPFLTDDEKASLNEAESYLWSLRYGLQMLAGRNENRLLFDHQRSLAELMGFRDSGRALAVEQLMQRYYQYAMVLSEINDVMLQLFDEDIVQESGDQDLEPLNRRFRIRRGYLEVVNPQTLVQAPFAMTEIFLHLAQHPEVRGIRARTIRAIRAHRHLIDDSFRKDLANTTLFMEILRTPHTAFLALAAMRRYGVLGKYIPEFGRITGQMQHDLFHVYTVDVHTMRVLRNMSDLFRPESMQEYPLAAWLIHRLPKPELLFIAGLFHDIAKGRGGDHSELGEEDAARFCRRHHLSSRDSSLVCWLVRQHLLMSMTAQRKDPSDPEVIRVFASQMQSQAHLDYLYVLTVCDISATNPKLWNSWRAALLRQLYSETVRTLRQGLHQFQSREEWIQDTRQEVREMLRTSNPLLSGSPFSEAAIESCFQQLDDTFFLQDSTVEISWQAAQILSHSTAEGPLVRVRDAKGGVARGFLQILVYLPYRQDLFALLTALLDQLQLNVAEARLSLLGDGTLLASFIVSSMDADPISHQHLAHELQHALQHPQEQSEILTRRIPRQLKHFNFQTQVTLSSDPINGQTVMEVLTPDRPGLLAHIARILLNFKVDIAQARIATLGERVEDVFLLYDEQGQALEDPVRCEELRCRLQDELDARNRKTAPLPEQAQKQL